MNKAVCWCIRVMVAITAAIATTLGIDGLFSVFAWPPNLFFEGWCASVAWSAAYDAQWLQRNLNAWWGPT